MNTQFSELGISPPLLNAIEEMGFQVPTEVQQKAIPHILQKEDVIVISKTGSGKTAVFSLPILQMTEAEGRGPKALILTPTRELAVQVDSDIKLMSKFLTHTSTAVYGQHSMNVEVTALKKGVTILAGTPGRVFDHIRQGNLKTNHIQYLVLDEADRMLDMGFLEQVVKIIKSIPKERTTLLFSATMPPEILRICKAYMKNPISIEIESQTKTVDTTEQAYFRVERNQKNTQLDRLLRQERPESCMIFCNTRFAVDKVLLFLLKRGYACKALHGDIPQAKRLKTIDQFKEGAFHLLVATDVAARGIHIDDLSLVINYDVPQDKDSYVHRIGRTGRAGNGGRAITLVTGDDIISLYEIEEHINAMIPEGELPSEDISPEDKELLEQWIAENTKKADLLRLTAEPKSLNEASNRTRGRGRDGRRRDGERPTEGKREGGAPRQRNDSRPDNRRGGRDNAPRKGEPREAARAMAANGDGLQKTAPRNNRPESNRPESRRPENSRPENRQSESNRSESNRPKHNRTRNNPRTHRGEGRPDHRPNGEQTKRAPQQQAQSKRDTIHQKNQQANSREQQEAPVKGSLFKRLVKKLFG